MAKKTLHQGRTKKRKAKSAPEAVSSGGGTEGHYPFYGALKGLIHIPPDLDLTEPADPEWGERVWGDDEK